MNRRNTLAAALCALLLAIAVLPAHAADKKPAKAPAAATKPGTAAPAAAPDPEAQKAAMMEMMKGGAPGPAHEVLKSMEGSWKAVTKWWAAPGDPAVTEGTCENRMILGGRFLEQHISAVMMGQPFEGVGMTGYDNQKGEYDFFWIDNSGTAMTTGVGSMDPDKKVLTTTGTMTGPDGKPTPYRMVTKLVDPDTHVFSMYATMGDKEQLMMETTYTRNK